MGFWSNMAFFNLMTSKTKKEALFNAINYGILKEGENRNKEVVSTITPKEVMSKTSSNKVDHKKFFLDFLISSSQFTNRVNGWNRKEGILFPKMIKRGFAHIEVGRLKLTINNRKISIKDCTKLLMYKKNENGIKQLHCHKNSMYDEKELRDAMIFAWQLTDIMPVDEFRMKTKTALYFYKGNELKTKIDNVLSRRILVLDDEKFIYTIQLEDELFKHILYDKGIEEVVTIDENDVITVSMYKAKKQKIRNIEAEYNIVEDGKVKVYCSVDGSKATKIMERYFEDRKYLERLQNAFDDDDTINYLLKVDINDLKSLEFLYFLSSRVKMEFAIYGVPISKLLMSLEGKTNKIEYDAYFYSQRERENYKELLKELYRKYDEEFEECEFPEKFPYPILTAEHQRTLLIKLLEEIHPMFENFTNQHYSYYDTHKAYNEEVVNLKKTYDDIYQQLISEGKMKNKWVNELNLYKLVKKEFPNTIYQYHPTWLGLQSLDIYIPDLNLAIEYQGEQHYKAVDFFGGEKGLEKRIELDNKKKELCLKNNIQLFEWKYDININKINLCKMLENYKK